MDNAVATLLQNSACICIYGFPLHLRWFYQLFLFCPGIEGMFFIFLIQVLYSTLFRLCLHMRPEDPEAEWRDSLRLVLMQSFGSLLVLVSLVPFSNPCLACEAHTQKTQTRIFNENSLVCKNDKCMVFENHRKSLASEAILRRQKFIKNAKIEKSKCDILSDFQTLCRSRRSNRSCKFEKSTRSFAASCRVAWRHASSSSTTTRLLGTL